jgi:hypothetical protein
VSPNWAEQITAVATAVLALSVFGAVAAAAFGAQQVREARRTRQAQMAAEFFRRWNEDSLVEARRLIASFASREELASAFQRYVNENAPEAYVLYRELDYFEQLAALERSGAFDFATIRMLVGEILVERWEMWSPALHAAYGQDVYPLFRELVVRMRRALDREGERSGGLSSGSLLRR